MLLVFDECRSDEDPDDETDEQDDGGPQAGAGDASLTTEKKSRHNLNTMELKTNLTLISTVITYKLCLYHLRISIKTHILNNRILCFYKNVEL